MGRHRQLEAQLTELGDAVAWPDADVAAGVRNRVGAETVRRTGIRAGWKVAFAAACAIAVIMVVPAGRQAVADLLGVAGIEISFGGSEPSAEPGRLDLGEETSLESAASQVDFPLAWPTLESLGEPDAVYIENGQTTLVHFAWDARPALPEVAGTSLGLLLTKFATPDGGPILTKDLTSETDATGTSVGDEEAIWLEGAPHELTYQATEGTATREISRLAGNVLLWESDGVTYRLESALELEEAVLIAESLDDFAP